MGKHLYVGPYFETLHIDKHKESALLWELPAPNKATHAYGQLNSAQWKIFVYVKGRCKLVARYLNFFHR